MEQQWQIAPTVEIPPEFLEIVQQYCPNSKGKFAAQLLWQRGIQNPQDLPPFLDPDRYYTPASPFEFGQEMQWAIERLQQARGRGEKVTIWGDFDADGVTSTSVLWEGLGQFLAQYLQLNYYIPNRLTESHGLNLPGIEKLAQGGTQLIVTCDTGSTNLTEIIQAQAWGIDIIVTDHHTLPPERPPVAAIINPRYFHEEHPLYHLSGVAVAYKLIEALYEAFPEIPQKPLEELLDLVAIGLIADLVALKGDCRYLAKRGIKQLKTQVKTPTRPGVAKLLELCQGNGDRVTDISFGLGPRINAVSRIYGNAEYVVELLTHSDPEHCQKLAQEAELANTRRKELQNSVVEAVKKRLAQIDLSTTPIIILDDPQWSVGVLGLVAGQIAQEYHRPTILLSTEEQKQESGFAKGSARSIQGIDLYELLASQQHLMHRFGGHPYAAGLSIQVENLALFKESLEQEMRHKFPEINLLKPKIQADLVVTVADLGKKLFRELAVLEPCGMGNPVPRLLIKNCWFRRLFNQNIDKNVKYIKTTFQICDSSDMRGFSGIWWGHYSTELSEQKRYDALVELDFNPSEKFTEKGYQVRLIDVREVSVYPEAMEGEWIVDYRGEAFNLNPSENCTVLITCPSSWDELLLSHRDALSASCKLALAYPSPPPLNSHQIWQQLQGMAKYLFRTRKQVQLSQIGEKLALNLQIVGLGLTALEEIGFSVVREGDMIAIDDYWPPLTPERIALNLFLEAIEEAHFKQDYFYQVPLTTIQHQLANW
ncbi:single-stranded-DNA-specific exonuclease RecJ [Spirulina subsalsa FACHB-351]|uniref:Single-stranded-DNA-specific exonuclease RecJ n=1 Tax=Spirulina subsalsa FACHB-351 TaxID=234711 RepID=A0ABT3L6F7_9CYAN|nr:single-stranded-DNA-specific exonuclease RecJ [Spirulina subsalsa]MCW6037091.1 single-stranded-DNA-specific exonuclease RecJ [Spirulina subsalsa FACHB-351]